MTLDDFRRLIARISLVAPMRPALVPVSVVRPVPKRPAQVRQPARPVPFRPA